MNRLMMHHLILDGIIPQTNTLHRPQILAVLMDRNN
jgi:hypothetical protein